MKNEKIYSYIENGILLLENVIEDFSNYIYTIVRNSNYNLQDEDIEEIVLDVFLTLWNNQNKLDINKKMSSYIAGITKNLIKKKYRQNKTSENIEDYEETLIDFSNIEISFIQREKNTIISNELDSMKQVDKDIFMAYYYFEKNIREIANYYNMSETKIKSKLFRIRKRLHKSLRKRGYMSNEK